MRARLTLMLAGLLAVACDFSFHPPLACKNTDDCPAGFACAVDECVAVVASVDAGADVGEGEGEGAAGEGEGAAAEGEGEGAAGEGEGAAGEGEGAAGEGEGEGAAGEGEGAAGEGEGEGVVGDPCDDGLACTDGDTFEPTQVCLGQFNGDPSTCSQCPAGCVQSLAAGVAGCCSGSDTICAPGQGPCLINCTLGCDVGCDIGSTCTSVQDGGDTPSMTCNQATCRSIIAGGAISARIACVAGALCDDFVHDAPAYDLTCDASSCHEHLTGGGDGVFACNNGASCTIDQTDVGTINVQCNSGSTCVAAPQSSNLDMTCGTGATCKLDADPSNSTTSLTCDADAISCAYLCGGVDLVCHPGDATCICS